VLNEDISRIIRIASNYEEHPYDAGTGGVKNTMLLPLGSLVTEFGGQALPDWIH